MWAWTCRAKASITLPPAARRYFRPETMALIDAVVDHEEVSPTLLMAS
jgi:hypothetical protein